MTSGDDPLRHRPGFAWLRTRRGWELHPGVRSADQLRTGDRAADLARNSLGSWTFTSVGVVLVVAGVVTAVRRHEDAGLVVLGIVLSGLALMELSLILMTARRADRTAGEAAVYDLERDRREAAAIQDLRDEVERLRGDLAALTARIQAGAHSGERADGR